jgi:hypothetical protein
MADGAADNVKKQFLGRLLVIAGGLPAEYLLLSGTAV